MKLLIYGSGVIGCLYAAVLDKAGYDTSVYAREKNSTVNKATLFGCRSYTFLKIRQPNKISILEAGELVRGSAHVNKRCLSNGKLDG